MRCFSFRLGFLAATLSGLLATAMGRVSGSEPDPLLIPPPIPSLPPSVLPQIKTSPPRPDNPLAVEQPSASTGISSSAGAEEKPIVAVSEKDSITVSEAHPPASVPENNLACCKDATGFDFKKVPPVRVFPRPGNFAITPTGPGYYSFLDVLQGKYREAPPRGAYPAFGLKQFSFFDADFRYLDDPNHTDHDYADFLKRIRVGDNWMFSTGGSFWNRYVYEGNSRLQTIDNTYDLLRLRTYADLWYRDQFRLYAEYIAAESVWQDLPPLPIDVNKSDLLNLFIDMKLAELDNHPIYARIGRQELIFGSQRLISPLEWANTRRTFQGIRAFRASEKFDVDLFWVQPVVPNANAFDSVDNNVNFAGLWTTYRPKKGTFLDLYYLFLDNTNTNTQQGIVRSPYNVHTLGTRFAGDQDRFLWDVELALQLGRRGSENILAGMFTSGAGYHFADAPLNPTFWVYYDYASGDHSPNSGTYNTFNQLYPFGHYYLGWLDQIGRQNIHDINMHLYLYPTKWTTVWLQYHHFWLDSKVDALYNAGGNAIRRDPSGRAGSNVGQEVDCVINFHLSAHSDVLLGYSRLFGGGFLEATSNRRNAADADLFYLQYNYRW